VGEPGLELLSLLVLDFLNQEPDTDLESSWMWNELDAAFERVDKDERLTLSLSDESEPKVSCRRVLGLPKEIGPGGAVRLERILGG
jgi:hypothetical protein